jgi:hypothetical protein
MNNLRARIVGLIAAMVCAAALLCAPSAPAKAQNISAEEAQIAREAYIYAYPMVVMEITRRVGTNVAEVAGLRSPMNQIAHGRAFPDPSFTDVVRPNADTLYSAMYFDVSKEPMIFSVPDSGGRYYLLQCSTCGRMFSQHPANARPALAPKLSRSLGQAGILPPGMDEIKSPTAMVMLVGRTQTNGKADYAAVHKFQDGIEAAPEPIWRALHTA